MKKLIAVAVGVAVAFSATVASAATYTRDLTIGSTGADVSSLQATLVSKGKLVMPAGVSMGYFGSLTKTALASYQASAGIAPAVGYFGPITRAHFNAMSDDNGGDDDNGDDDGDDELQGGEGDIKDFNILGNPSDEDLNEGETKNVYGFEVEVEDSDIRVERVEILASSTRTVTTKSNEPWDYIESAVLYMGDEEVASVDGLDDEDAWDEESTNDTYTFRFDDIDGAVINEDDTEKFYVEFTAVDGLDSDDEGGSFDIALADEGFRAVDAEGIDLYEQSTVSETREVTFEGPDSGDLDISIDDEDNLDRTVFVDEDTETESVEIMRFTIEANASDNTIDELDVVLATTTSTTTHIANVVSSLRLEVDGDEISSESVPNVDTGNATVTFDNLEDDFAVEEDDEIEVVVYADIEAQEGNYGEGYAFEASVAGSSIDAQDSEGDDVTVSGTVTGGEVELRVNGMVVEFVSSEENVTTATVAGNPDTVQFLLKFEVTANGDDIYVDGDTVATATPSTLTDGIAWATTSDTTTATGTPATAVLTATDGYKSSDTNTAGNKLFKINDGSSRTFTLSVLIPAGGDNVDAAIAIAGIKWDIASGDSTDFLYDLDLAEFRSELVQGLYVR